MFLSPAFVFHEKYLKLSGLYEIYLHKFPLILSKGNTLVFLFYSVFYGSYSCIIILFFHAASSEQKDKAAV